MSPDDMKQAAAEAAIELVRPGMKLGLGTGSTAAKFVDLVGARVAAGLEVICVPTSQATKAQAEQLQIPLTTLDETPELDLTVDGADEFDPHLQLIKGGGGALLREKIVASASARMAVISDNSKFVETLGAFPLPVEVVQFAHPATCRRIEQAARALGCAGAITLRREGGAPFITDNGNVIYDCAFSRIPDAPALASALCAIAGVVEHGLFIGLADIALMATPEGVREIRLETRQVS